MSRYIHIRAASSFGERQRLVFAVYYCSEPFASLDLLGLSITGCPSSALSLTSGKRLLLSNTHLKGSNAKELAEDGGAALLAGIIEARPRQRDNCFSSRWLLIQFMACCKPGCIWQCHSSISTVLAGLQRACCGQQQKNKLQAKHSYLLLDC
jgi:hypothetical protein